MRKAILYIVLCISTHCYTQETKEVLFIGNSYIYYNDMPLLLEQAANSAGDTVIQDDNAVPNASLSNHASDGITRSKIMQGNWDFVVFQERGRLAARDDDFVEVNVYPYAAELNALVEAYNSCGSSLYFMTWGEENGDPVNCSIWPPVCTYEGMDDLIRLRYLIMAEDNEAATSPVGAVWRYLRTNHPEIELYDPDGAHPALAGSYAAAITFYTSIFRKDPNLVTFNATLPSAVANAIKSAVQTVVYNDLSGWYIGVHDPVANFTYNNNGNLEYQFVNTSQFSSNYLWDFGDGSFSTDENPIHTFSEEGSYEVVLTADFFCVNASSTTNIISVTLGLDGFSERPDITIYPNPAQSNMTIHTSVDFVSELDLSLYNLAGIKMPVYESISTKTQVHLDVSEFPTGCYFLKISNEASRSEIIQFIVE